MESSLDIPEEQKFHFLWPSLRFSHSFSFFGNGSVELKDYEKFGPHFKLTALHFYQRREPEEN